MNAVTPSCGAVPGWRSGSLGRPFGQIRGTYSDISHKFGATADDAADIFQAVSLDLISDLGKLRQPQALRAWLMQVTSRKCLQWKQAQQRRAEVDLSQIELDLPQSLIVSPILLEEVER